MFSSWLRHRAACAVFTNIRMLPTYLFSSTTMKAEEATERPKRSYRYVRVKRNSTNFRHKAIRLRFLKAQFIPVIRPLTYIGDISYQSHGPRTLRRRDTRESIQRDLCAHRFIAFGRPSLFSQTVLDLFFLFFFSSGISEQRLRLLRRRFCQSPSRDRAPSS